MGIGYHCVIHYILLTRFSGAVYTSGPNFMGSPRVANYTQSRTNIYIYTRCYIVHVCIIYRIRYTHIHDPLLPATHKNNEKKTVRDGRIFDDIIIITKSGRERCVCVPITVCIMIIYNAIFAVLCYGLPTCTVACDIARRAIIVPVG